MLKAYIVRFVCVAALAAAIDTAPASAQPLGTFTWQMQPYCNVVTLSLTATPAGYTIGGLDDQCGGDQRAGVVGMAAFTRTGNVTLTFTIILAPSGQPLHVSAEVNPANGSGTWTDSAGNRGTFVYFAAAPGLPPRPMALSGLGPDVITSAEIAPGSVGASDINPAEVQARVTGTCGAGSVMIGVNGNGSVTCLPVPPPVTGVCPSGTAMASVNGNGTVSCAPVQLPVTGACPAGQAVVSVSATGAVVCGATDPASVRFRARGVTPVTLASNNFAVLTWSAEVQNVGGGGYDTASGLYTVPVAGTYLVTGTAIFETASSPNGYYCLLAAVNGGLDTQATCQNQGSGGLQLPNVSTVLTLSAGQTVALVAINGSSGTQRVSGTAQQSDFTVTRLP
jgi:hypothetical protein